MIILIVLLALILRLINLDQSFWLDEAIGVLAVKQHSFFDLLTLFVPRDVHPPLYYLVLDAWDQTTSTLQSNSPGFQEALLRFPSVIFSLGAVFFTYKIGVLFKRERLGLLAALFLALNPLFVYYSQEARMYTLATLGITGAFYFFLSRQWLGYFFLLSIALFADYLPYLMLPVFFFLSQNKKQFILLHLLFFTFFLPWLPIALNQFSAGANFARIVPAWGSVVGGISVKSLLLVPVKFILGRISFENQWFYALVVGVSVSYIGLILLRVREWRLWLWLVLPILSTALISLFVPIFSYYRFLFVVPAFCLVLALGVEKNRLLSIGVVVISLASLIYFHLSPQLHREDWRQAVRGYMEEEEGVALMPSLAQAAPIYYYRDNLVVQDKNNVDITDVHTVYLIRYVQELFDPQDWLRIKLETSGYRKVEEKWFNGVLVWKYRL